MHRDATRRSIALFGIAGADVAWRRRVEEWMHDAQFPLHVSFCPSIEHLLAGMRSAAVPAVLLDGDLAVVDRDLLAAVTNCGAAAVVVEHRRQRPWTQLGASAVLPTTFDGPALLAALGQRALPVDGRRHERPPPTARLVAVTGPGGTGASVAAIALAQGLAATHDRVLLVDCCLHAEQAMLHNAHGAHPGLADAVDLHADGVPGPRQIRQLTVGVVERGYHLLLGLRRARHWSGVGPASLDSTVTSLAAAFDLLVADCDADVEGEAEGGSADVEERNALSRTIIQRADVTVVVGQPTMKGVYALVRTMVELLEFGVPAARLLPVINQASDDSTARAELSRAVHHLVVGATGSAAPAPVLFLPTVALEDRLRDREAIPDALPDVLATATASVLQRHDLRSSAPTPSRVAVGSLGHWASS